MNKIKQQIKEYFNTPGFGKRFAIMMIGVFFMGFFLSFLIEVNLGTDPCTFMNLAISNKLGILFGTWQMVLNIILFVPVIFWGLKHIGFGTLANMILVGYISDFFRWLWKRTIPKSVFTEMPTRAVVFVLALFAFIVAVSFYMNANMGVAPYDAVPLMISEYIFKKVPFSIIRMCFDFSVILIGILFGGTPNIGIVLMALFLGPVISAVGKVLNEKVFHI